MGKSVPLNIVKLCVGIDTVADLIRYKQALAVKKGKRAGRLEDCHVTRMWPRRMNEILGGGSLYWVIRGFICARHPILRFEEVDKGSGAPYCAIVYDPQVILTEARPRRAFQGWRYLDPSDAPPDLKDQRRALRAALRDAALPEKMRAELRMLGLV